jgi:hypothetical protein
MILITLFSTEIGSSHKSLNLSKKMVILEQNYIACLTVLNKKLLGLKLAQVELFDLNDFP